MAKLSVIMPIYNAENTLTRAIESVLQQTFSDLNLILVDDGSTDQSLSICQSFAQKDKRIIVIHQKNSGPSAARNAALEIVTGDYVAFVDADDHLEPQMYETLINAFLTDGSTLVMCGYQREFVFNEKPVRSQKISFPSISISNKEQLKEFFNDLYLRNYFHLVWNKIYSFRIIQENYLRFPVNINNGEDLIFNLSYIPHVNRIQIYEDVLYHYISNDSIQSLTTLSNKNVIDLFENKVYLYQAIHSFLLNSLSMKENELNRCADSDIFLRDCFQIIDVSQKVEKTLNTILNHNATQTALKYKGCGKIEFLLYRNVLRLENSKLISMVSYLRIFVKKFLRGRFSK